jgi:hypothetical protein
MRADVHQLEPHVPPAGAQRHRRSNPIVDIDQVSLVGLQEETGDDTHLKADVDCRRAGSLPLQPDYWKPVADGHLRL